MKDQMPKLAPFEWLVLATSFAFVAYVFYRLI